MALTVTDLVKEYPTPGKPLRVLDDVSLTLESGRNLAVIGPSGSGKSTLLSIIGTLEPATSGAVELDGQETSALDSAALAAFRRERIGFVFQEHHLLPQCTVLENVLMPTIAAGRTNGEQEAWAHTLIERVGLSRRATHLPAELSGGERQRTAICRALIQKPSLVLADEPTGNLDRTTSREVAELLLELQQEQGSMMIVVTHSLELADMMDRQLELDAGRLADTSGEKG